MDAFAAAKRLGPNASKRDDWMSKFSARRLLQQRSTLASYAGTIALAIIAVIAMQFVIAAAQITQGDATVLVDLLREQQNRAHRIASFVASAAEGNQAWDLQRQQVTNRFARTHEHLRQANEALGVSKASAAAFQALYAEGERPLAADVEEFLARTRAFEGSAPQDRKRGRWPPGDHAVCR